jgi:hypothetical protein
MGAMNLALKLGLFFIFVFFLVSITSPVGRAFEDEPSETSDTVNHQETSGFNLGAAIVSIFRDHISAVDGDRCPSVPTCSAYGVESFQKHGFFKGWMMMVDRLIHEGKEETAVSPLIYTDGKWKIYDPVSNNDFWWYPPEKKPPPIN